jgi:hypothetical protein
MQMVAVIVGSQRVGDAVKRELSGSNAIGVTPGDGTLIRSILLVSCDVVVAQDHVGQFAASIRGFD